MTTSASQKIGARPDIDDYEAIFLNDTPMFDTRAPIEFNKGAFPHTLSLPLMSDIERAKVGTCYKRDGQEAAIALGHRLVAGDIKQARLQAWLAFAQQNPDGYMYCFRGGLRSHTTQKWLADVGCHYPLVKGGYKAMRRFLIDKIDDICARAINPECAESFVIMGGQTGAAKTDLLLKLPNAIDLEGLANHRGSAFGKRATAQPSQINFENDLAIQFLRQHHRAPHTPILLEDESYLIGRCALPKTLRSAMLESPIVVVEADLEQRVEHSFRNYILHKLAEWQDFCSAPNNECNAFDKFAQELRQSLLNIRKRLGGERYQELSTLLNQALSAHEAGDNNLHREWIRHLLYDYYDPQYNAHLHKRKERIVFRGNSSEIEDYLRSLK